ncbi:H-type small acid-soluble spore protein [Salipaludibacillus agaradhaerens]|jgi:small acid-soluble spore protein H (minor)|uniref:Small, acid-soluble spore protein H n=1 Tax=Salipaludibacillus agaradhaerens TaxID=76935 RepID=A0A9Q4G160_SALAG|nr:H-type small acid-soluble spore protein [Salipaludibacillus agaradhaerens]MCR6098702.1 H-type small acid-soluble spore protein [Salipaludibacillus agaradhaerens]MCR6115709.1 H-type small acid-soluble spore protein [Salipaludibacillus agaradhaerens]
METQRVKEIIEAPTMINVSYKGVPVYIESLDDSSRTAVVFPLDEMDHLQEVDIDGLVEEGP